MEDKEYDIAGIGSPLLDLTYNIDYKILEDLDLKKGEMHIIDKDKSKWILERLKDDNSNLSPGGSTSNTLSGASAFGSKTVLFGKIGKDSHGEIYENKTNEDGVISKLSKHEIDATGHAIVLITPDSERTFATHLGAAIRLRKEDIIEDIIKKSKILHIEAYQLEDPDLRETSLYAIKIAKENNVKVSLDLSDPALVNRNKELFTEFLRDNVDIVFANESEAEAFTGKQDKEALDELSRICEIAVVKLGNNGSLIKKDDEIYEIPVYKSEVINTNGAGDMYAGGLLHGIANNINIKDAGNKASYAASLVVSNSEPRLNSEQKNKIKIFDG